MVCSHARFVGTREIYQTAVGDDGFLNNNRNPMPNLGMP